MPINIAKLRQFSIGVIIFSVLLVAFMILGILGATRLFYQEVTNPALIDTLQTESKNDHYYYFDPETNKLYSSILSVYICAVAFSIMSILFCFWLFFTIKNFSISLKIDKVIKSDLKKLAIINFFTFFIGSVLQLATCNMILEKFRLQKSKINKDL